MSYFCFIFFFFLNLWTHIVPSFFVVGGSSAGLSMVCLPPPHLSFACGPHPSGGDSCGSFPLSFFWVGRQCTPSIREGGGYGLFPSVFFLYVYLIHLWGLLGLISPFLFFGVGTCGPHLLGRRLLVRYSLPLSFIVCSPMDLIHLWGLLWFVSPSPLFCL